MRPIRAPQARGSGKRATAGRSRAEWARTYARYPRFPQADSVWCDSVFVTASGRGRDDRPATVRKPSQPRPERNGPLCPTRQRGNGAKAGRLTKPPPGGSYRACPNAQADAAGFEKRPNGSGRLRAREPTGRTPGGLRVFQDRPGGKRGLRASASPPGGNPGLRSMDPSGGTKASAEDPAGSGQGFGGGREGGNGNASSPIRRAANRQGFGPVGEPGETARRPAPGGLQNPGQGPRPGQDFETARADCLASQAWFQPRRDSGGRQRCRPPLLFRSRKFCADPVETRYLSRLISPGRTA